jgi:hypothetical protein
MSTFLLLILPGFFDVQIALIPDLSDVLVDFGHCRNFNRIANLLLEV